MKIDVKIEWLIDDSILGVESSKTDTVSLDADYVEADEADIVQYVENELNEKYRTPLVRGEDFEIANIEDIIEDLAFDEFKDKTGYSSM